MPNVVCIGDVTQDNFFFIEDASVHCDLSNENCELTLKYGSKIPVEKYAVCMGGNAGNVSVGLSRLGIETSLLTIFGDDERGAWVKRQLMENGVDLTYAQTEENRLSNISSIVVFKKQRTILTYHSEGQKELTIIPLTKWIYLTSAPGNNSEKLFEIVADYKKDNPEVSIAFNPYPADLKKGKDFLKKVLDITDVLILNKEEAEMLGAKPACRQAGITVITDGASGAKVLGGPNTIEKPSVATEVVEVTGAGDAFSSGFVAALYYGQDLGTALDWGLKNSASVISKIGSIEGLLSYERLSK